MDRIAFVAQSGRFYIDRHAAVIPHLLVRSGRFVEQRSLSDVRIAHQRHVNRLGRLTEIRILPGGTSRAIRFVFPVVLPDTGHPRRKTGSIFRNDLSFPTGGHFDTRRFTAAQGHLISHDLVFDRIGHRGAFDHRDALATHESHFGDPLAESPVSLYFNYNPGLSRRQGRKLYCIIFFSVQNPCYFRAKLSFFIFPEGHSPPDSKIKVK